MRRPHAQAIVEMAWLQRVPTQSRDAFCQGASDHWHLNVTIVLTCDALGAADPCPAWNNN